MKKIDHLPKICTKRSKHVGLIQESHTWSLAPPSDEDEEDDLDLDLGALDNLGLGRGMSNSGLLSLPSSWLDLDLLCLTEIN